MTRFVAMRIPPEQLNKYHGERALAVRRRITCQEICNHCVGGQVRSRRVEGDEVWSGGIAGQALMYSRQRECSDTKKAEVKLGVALSEQ